MDFKWSYVGYVLLAIFVIIILLLVMGRPAVTVEGQICESDCTYPVVDVPPRDGWDSATVCPAGCFIKTINYTGGGTYRVTCACCDCEMSGEASAALGECNYKNPILDTLGAMLNLCRLPESE